MMKPGTHFLVYAMLTLVLSGCGKSKDLDASVAKALVEVVYSWEDPRQLDLDLTSVGSIGDYSNYIAGVGGRSDDFDLFASLAWRYYEWNLFGEACEWIEQSSNERVDFTDDLEIMLLALCGETQKLEHSLKKPTSIPIGRDALVMISRGESMEGVLAAVKVLTSNAAQTDKRKYYVYADFVSKVLVRENIALPLDIGDEFFDPLFADFTGGGDWEHFVSRLKSGSITHVQTVLLNQTASTLANASVYFERIGDLDRSGRYKNLLRGIAAAVQESDRERGEWFSYLLSKGYPVENG